MALTKARLLKHDFLRELGSYILRATTNPSQLKPPGRKPTIEQLKRPVRRTDPPVTAEKKKAYTTTTERKSFGELF